MTGDVDAHQTNTDVILSTRREVFAGTDVPLKVEVSCPLGCDLRGGTVRVIAQDGTVVKEVPVTSFEEGINGSGEFALEAPIDIGECTWNVAYPGREVGTVIHRPSSTQFSFTVTPHSTSIAVWDLTSPIALGDKFKIKVGVKCSAACELTGCEIAVYGQRGRKVATETLGDLPWPGSSALYWAEVELEAPSAEGHHKWRVGFRDPHLELPHSGASHRLSFATARRPQHIVTIRVADKHTKSPIEGAMVTVRARGTPYQARTDADGVASLRVPTGDYNIYAVKHRYADFQTTVEVGSDLDLRAELELTPPSQWGGWPNR